MLRFPHNRCARRARRGAVPQAHLAQRRALDVGGGRHHTLTDKCRGHSAADVTTAQPWHESGRRSATAVIRREKLRSSLSNSKRPFDQPSEFPCPSRWERCQHRTRSTCSPSPRSTPLPTPGEPLSASRTRNEGVVWTPFRGLSGSKLLPRLLGRPGGLAESVGGKPKLSHAPDAAPGQTLAEELGSSLGYSSAA